MHWNWGLPLYYFLRYVTLTYNLYPSNPHHCTFSLTIFNLTLRAYSSFIKVINQALIMPIVYSKIIPPAFANQILWIDDYLSLERQGLLSDENRALGYRSFIPAGSDLLKLSPEEYLRKFDENFHETIPASPIRFSFDNADLNPLAHLTSNPSTESGTRGLGDPFVDNSMPTLQVNGLDAATSPTSRDEPNSMPSRPGLTTRKSSTMHQNIMKKLRPMPFQYVWSVWHDKAGSTTSTPVSTSESYSTRLTLLAAEVPDIGAFYRIYNNFPWDGVKNKDSVHVFRAGVKPLWEDPENLEGGSLTVKVKREDGKGIKAWEELCMMACGGELQAAVLPGRSSINSLLQSLSY